MNESPSQGKELSKRREGGLDMADEKERRSDYILLGEISADIKTVKGDMRIVKEKVNKHGEDLAALNVRTGLVGALSGSIATIILYLKLTMAKGGH